MLFITEYLLNEWLQEHANMLMDSAMKENFTNSTCGNIFFSRYWKAHSATMNTKL